MKLITKNLLLGGILALFTSSAFCNTSPLATNTHVPFDIHITFSSRDVLSLATPEQIKNNPSFFNALRHFESPVMHATQNIHHEKSPLSLEKAFFGTKQTTTLISQYTTPNKVHLNVKLNASSHTASFQGDSILMVDFTFNISDGKGDAIKIKGTDVMGLNIHDYVITVNKNNLRSMTLAS